MAKAIILITSGLDSLLAVKLMQETTIQIQPVHFDIGLTNNRPILAGQRISKYLGLEYFIKNGIEIDKVDIAKEFYTQILSQGDTKNTNICLEHRIFFLKKAKEYMEEQGADFIVTGDIIDQRPSIQSLSSLRLTDQHADVEGKVFRPLCAMSMPTPLLQKKYPELLKIMFDFRGFAPEREKLAEKLKLISYPIAHNPDLKETDMGKKAFDIFEKAHFVNTSHLSRLGVHFEFEENANGIIGRTSFESNYIKNFYEKMKPEKGIAFYIEQPEFLFGFIYGEAINETHEQIAPHIFCHTIDPSEKPKHIFFLDHNGDLLGSKEIQPLKFEDFNIYLSNIQ